MAFRPTDPVQARQIAEHTAHAIAEMRRSLTLDQLGARHRDWTLYADGVGVAPQIRDHVRGVVNDVAISIKAKRVVRDPTGEAARDHDRA
jgi:hypothetical protein